MSPLHRSQYYPSPSLGDNNQDQTPPIPFFPPYETPTLSYTVPFPSQQEVGEHLQSGESSVLTAKTDSGDERINGIKKFTGDASAKWLPSKMRLMKRMIDSNKTITRKSRKNLMFPQNQYSTVDTNPCNGFIRVCSDCNTTKTPLWRSGPQGPKSLCNACGIRQRKARKAMAEAAANGDHGYFPSGAPRNLAKEKGLEDVFAIVPFKKRCKYSSEHDRDRENFTISSLQNSSDCHGVFPQDEKEAAILLMALSGGLVCR